jgi:hypothetical protein
MIAVVTIPKSYSSAFMARAANHGLYIGPTEVPNDLERYPEGDLEHRYLHYYIMEEYQNRLTWADMLKMGVLPNVDLREKVNLDKIDIVKLPVHYFQVLEYYEPTTWVITKRDPEVVKERLSRDDNGESMDGAYESAVNIMETFKKKHPEALEVDMDRYMAGDTAAVDEVLLNG